MLKSIFIYAPCIFAMVGIGVCLLRHRLRYLDWWLLTLLLLFLMYFFADTWSFMDTPPRRWSFIVDIVGKVTLMAIVPSAIFWYWSRFQDRNAGWYYYLIYLFPAIMLVALCTLYGTMGPKVAVSSSAYFYWRDTALPLAESVAHVNLRRLGVTVFNCMLLVEVILFVMHFIVELARLLKLKVRTIHEKYRIRVIIVMLSMVTVTLIRMVFGYNYLLQHNVLSALFYVAFAAVIFMVVFYDVCDAVLDEDLQLTEHVVRRLLNQAPSFDRNRFERLMIANRWCYKKGVSEDMVANELGITKTYLGYMLKTYYGKTFVAWVVDNRIAYAQELMLANPNVRQADIAAQCGFADVSVFSRTFSKEVKMTPREWLLIHKQ